MVMTDFGGSSGKAIFSNRLLLSSKEFSLSGTNILIDLDNFENPIGLDAILGPSLNHWLAETHDNVPHLSSHKSDASGLTEVFDFSTCVASLTAREYDFCGGLW